jgi:hypothetical protein
MEDESTLLLSTQTVREIEWCACTTRVLLLTSSADPTYSPASSKDPYISRAASLSRAKNQSATGQMLGSLWYFKTTRNDHDPDVFIYFVPLLCGRWTTRTTRTLLFLPCTMAMVGRRRRCF